MIKATDIADAISMCSFALPAMRSAEVRRAGKAEIIARGVISGFGGGFLRDCVLASVACGVSFAILTSMTCWTGILITALILLVLKFINRDSVLESVAVRWTLILIDGGGSARFLCYAGRKCFDYGITTEPVVVLLSFATATGGGFLNIMLRKAGRLPAIRKRIVPYSIWVLFAWIYYRLAYAGYDGAGLTMVFILIGMMIAAIDTTISEDEPPLINVVKRGIAFSYRIGLYLSRGKQFNLIKTPGKGRHVLRLIRTVSGDTIAALETI